MIRRFARTVVCLCLFSSAVFVGCDKTVSEKTTEKSNSDGSTSVDKTKTTQSPDGTMQTKTEHSENNK